MNSTLSPPSVDQRETSSDIDCYLFTFDAYVIFFGTMCVFGLVGNGLSWAVLRWDRRSSGRVATFLLQTMAVIDNLFLLTAGISHITAAVTLYIHATSATNNALAPPTNADNSSLTTPMALDALPTQGPNYSNITVGLHPPVGGVTSYVVRAYITAYVTVCVWPLVHITQMWAVWITVLVAFNRYVAICMPFQAHRLCTMRQVRCQMACLGLSIVFYNIPRWLEYRVIYSQEFGDVSIPASLPTELKNSPTYNVLYESLLYCLFVFLGPLLILIVLNACLIQELVRARRRLQQRNLPGGDTSDDQGEQNLTLVMVIIIVIFVVCQSPAFGNQLLDYLIGDEQYACGKPYFYYYHISNLLVTANSSVNFVVYCVFRRQFRRRLYACCCPTLLAKQHSATTTSECYPLRSPHTHTANTASGNAHRLPAKAS